MGQSSFYAFILDRLKPYKKWFTLAVLSRFCWAIHMSLLSYMSKLIIDKMDGFTGLRADIVGYILPYMGAYLVVWLVISCCYRFMELYRN